MEHMFYIIVLIVVVVWARRQFVFINEALLNHRDAIRSLKPQPILEVEQLQQQPPVLSLHGHTIVVGQTGSGKSNILMSQIIERLRDGQQLHCIDVKDEIRPIFGRHVQCVSLAEASKKFDELLWVAQERRDLFSAASADKHRPCRDYREYETITGIRLPVITLVCEELIVLRSEVDESKLINLLVIGRSAGVFVFCLSQYLKADILSRKGSINFTTQVFIGKFDSVSVRLLFGTLNKEELAAVKEYVGKPGYGAVMCKGEMTLHKFAEVAESDLLPFFSHNLLDELLEKAPV